MGYSRNSILELLKNSIAIVNKIVSIDYFIERRQDGELIFQQLYSINNM